MTSHESAEDRNRITADRVARAVPAVPGPRRTVIAARIPTSLICTGTPPGVGMGQSTPRYLKPGNTMRLGITGLGEQHQRVVPAPADAIS